jgi:hypothetical protein
MLSRVADAPVEGKVGRDDAFESVRETLAEGSFDDVIISTLPKRASEWLRKDLPTRVEALGLPVTIVTGPEEPSPLQAFTDSISAKTTSTGPQPACRSRRSKRSRGSPRRRKAFASGPARMTRVANDSRRRSQSFTRI